MRNFTYYSPTKVVFGKGEQRKAGELAASHGAKRVMILSGGKSAEESGLLDEVRESLHDATLDMVDYTGIVPNPRLSQVYEAIEIAKDKDVDFLLAVGGGSVIDTAKAVAYGLRTAEDVWDYFLKTKEPKDAAPIGVVSTIAASGSETSNSSVITNENGWLKRGLRNDLVRPKFAILNPELTMTLPWYQTACGCVDIVMHALERYFTPNPQAEVRDILTEGLVRAVIRNSRVLRETPDNYNARAEVMWAGSIAHNDLLGDRFTGDWACHQLEHELSGMFDVAHGAGLAAIWPSWANYVYKSDLPRFASFATNIFDIYTDFADLEATAVAGIGAMKEWMASLDMPTRVSQMDIGLTDDRIKELARKCTFDGTRTIGAIRKLDGADIENIYRDAR